MTIRGAIYIPARAFNAYQMWTCYDPSVTERDLGYAAGIGINAIRVWLSYECWLEQGEGKLAAVEHLLEAASAKGIKVLPALFEGCGIAPSPESLNDRNPLTGVCTYSPSKDIYEHPERFAEPVRFVRSFMERFKDDSRLLAIEVMNEPNEVARIHFARAMLKEANGGKGSAPLTMGCASVEDHLYYIDIGGIDVLQNHLNFPASLEEVEKRLRMMRLAEQTLGKPCYLGEWQRVRTGVRAPGGASPVGDEWQPCYAPYAELINKAGADAFVWSLMVKPAYLPGQRRRAVLNGIFHEDGAVWSLEDARAIAGNPAYAGVERKEWPDWLKIIPETYNP